jgi:hypothetical protein
MQFGAEEQGLTTGVAHKGNNLYSIGVLFGIGEQPGAVAPWEQVGPKGEAEEPHPMPERRSKEDPWILSPGTAE